ncbi:hypothetical protein NZK32_09140 [Cyanobium sp. FGCU-52]|nr:hypothetical protein [Cyanobium sp. FGCU52]
MNDRFLMLQRQPRRITITLSYNVHEALLDRSEEEGRSVSNLCAFLLEESLRHPQGMPRAGAGMPEERRQDRRQILQPSGDGHLRQRLPG